MKRGKKGQFRPSVFIVAYKILADGTINYILLKRKLHWKGWEFPKGKIESGESKSKTARREAREETGLRVVKLKKFSVNGKYPYHKLLPDRPNYIGQTYTLFSAQVKDGKVKLDKKEHSGHIWLPFNKAIKKLTWPNQKKCLRIVNKRLMQDKKELIWK